MELRYDFHIHSCLSPCGDDDMTPHNIVAMATILELDAIALTDHNAVGNCEATIQAGLEAGILVIPGMELSTAEEIHMLCLFPNLSVAKKFEKAVMKYAPKIQNKPEIFGKQIYMNNADKILGYEERLLISASGISIDDVAKLCKEYNSICYPAHIERKSNGIISSFGMFDKTMGFNVVELADPSSLDSLTEKFPDLSSTGIMYSSDAHNLEKMATFDHKTISPDRVSANGIIEYISNL